MSVDATIATWKLSKEQVTPTQKLILLSLADRANEIAECFPSVKRLQNDTGLDRHAICRNKQQLIAKGLISYTGEKRGKTKSVDIIRLNYVVHREGRIDECDFDWGSSAQTPTASKLSSAQTRTTKQCTNVHTEPNIYEPIDPKVDRSSFDKEDLPKVDRSTPTKKSKNLKSSSLKPIEYKETLFPMPLELNSGITINSKGIPQELIDEYILIRKKKRAPITPTSWKLLSKNLQECVDAGFDLVECFELMVSNAWLTIKADWIRNRTNSNVAPEGGYYKKNTGWYQQYERETQDIMEGVL